MKQLEVQSESSNIMRTGLEPNAAVIDGSGPFESTAATAAPDAAVPEADGVWHGLNKIQIILYWGVHVSCFAAIWTGVNRVDLALLATTFFVRMFAITGGYHRYFSHRTYRTSRAFQFVLALLATSSVQKGPLWWAANHRLHHRHSDEPGDPHSPRVSLWYAHQGWISNPEFSPTRVDEVKDLARYPELVWLNKWHITSPILLGVLCFAIGGWSGLVWGFAISTTLAWHSTYTINSLSHRFGTQRFDTGDDSRNNPILAILTLGEGWHNNHHYFQSSTRQGFRWWEVDITYMILRGLQALGIVWGIKEPPARLLRPEPKHGA